MASHLMQDSKRLIRLLFVLAGCTSLAAGAQALSDPTRPPAEMTQQGGDPVKGEGPILQSILISPQRRVAIIDGRTVTEGDAISGARVARITETEVFLRTGDEARVLRMYPALEKKFAGTAKPERGNGKKQ